MRVSACRMSAGGSARIESPSLPPTVSHEAGGGAFSIIELDNYWLDTATTDIIAGPLP